MGVDTMLKVGGGGGGGLCDNCAQSARKFCALMISLELRLAKLCCFQPLNVSWLSMSSLKSMLAHM